MIPQGKTIQDGVEETIDYFLKNLDKQKQEEIYAAYQKLCQSIEANNDDSINCAKKLVDLLYALDQRIVEFTDFMNLLLHNYKTVLDTPSAYEPSYVQEVFTFVKDFFEKKHRL